MLDLLSYWGKHPPVHVMVKAYLYGNDKSSSVSKPATADDMAEMAAAVEGF
jgi:hypothetical protein